MVLVEAQVKQFLEDNKGEIYTEEEIANKLDISQIKVSNALYKMAEEDKIKVSLKVAWCV